MTQMPYELLQRIFATHSPERDDLMVNAHSHVPHYVFTILAAGQDMHQLQTVMVETAEARWATARHNYVCVALSSTKPDAVANEVKAAAREFINDPQEGQIDHRMNRALERALSTVDVDGRPLVFAMVTAAFLVALTECHERTAYRSLSKEIGDAIAIVSRAYGGGVRTDA